MSLQDRIQSLADKGLTVDPLNLRCSDCCAALHTVGTCPHPGRKTLLALQELNLNWRLN